MNKIAAGFFICAAALVMLVRPSGADARGLVGRQVIEGLMIEGGKGGIEVNMRLYDSVFVKALKKKKSSSAAATPKKVKLYVTSWCPYCAQMEQFLRTAQIPYIKYDIEGDRLAYKRYKNLEGNGVPLLVVNETVIYGYDTDSVLEAWQRW